MEAESGEGGFHESGGRLRLGGEVALSEKHKEVGNNADMKRERAEEGAGAGAGRPGSFHSCLLTAAGSGQQLQPDGRRLQLGKKKQDSRGQTQMLRENHHFRDS